MGTTAALAHPCSHALDAELARIVFHAGIDPHGLAFVASAVVQVAGGERAFGAETALDLIYRRLVAGDDTALDAVTWKPPSPACMPLCSVTVW